MSRDNVEAEIVAYGPGVSTLTAESRIADRLALALGNDIALEASENTMRNTKIQASEMHEGVRLIDPGIVHIMKPKRKDRLTRSREA